MTYFKLNWNLPGANELIVFLRALILRPDVSATSFFIGSDIGPFPAWCQAIILNVSLLTLKSKFWWNLNPNTNIYIKEDIF